MLSFFPVPLQYFGLKLKTGTLGILDSLCSFSSVRAKSNSSKLVASFSSLKLKSYVSKLSNLSTEARNSAEISLRRVFWAKWLMTQMRWSSIFDTIWRHLSSKGISSNSLSTTSTGISLPSSSSSGSLGYLGIFRTTIAEIGSMTSSPSICTAAFLDASSLPSSSAFDLLSSPSPSSSFAGARSGPEESLIL